MNWLAKSLTALALLAATAFAAGAGDLKQTAEPRWSASIFAGYTDHDSDMQEALRLPFDSGLREEKLVGVALAYRAGRFLNHFTLEFEGGLGRRFPISDATEAWAAAFIRFDGFPWKHMLYTSLGASLGVNYVSALPASELPTLAEPDRPTSKLLHYFSPEIAFALPDHRQHEMFVRLHHRSGMWGLFNGVHGASDALVLGYRLRF